MRNRQQFEQLVFEKAKEKKLYKLTPSSVRIKYVTAAAAIVITIGLGTGLYFYNAEIPLNAHDSNTHFVNNTNNINNTINENNDTSRYATNNTSEYEYVSEDELSQPEPINNDFYTDNNGMRIPDCDSIEDDGLQFTDRVDYTANGSTVQITDIEKVENIKEEVSGYIYVHDGMLSSDDVYESPEIMLCKLEVLSYWKYDTKVIKTTVWVYSDHIYVESDDYLYNSDGEPVVRLPRYEDVVIGGYFILNDEFVQMIQENIDGNFTV